MIGFVPDVNFIQYELNRLLVKAGGKPLSVTPVDKTMIASTKLLFVDSDMGKWDRLDDSLRATNVVASWCTSSDIARDRLTNQRWDIVCLGAEVGGRESMWSVASWLATQRLNLLHVPIIILHGFNFTSAAKIEDFLKHSGYRAVHYIPFGHDLLATVKSVKTLVNCEKCALGVAHKTTGRCAVGGIRKDVDFA